LKLREEEKTAGEVRLRESETARKQLLSIMEDLDDAKRELFQSMDLLRDSEEKFRQISENMGEVFWLWDVEQASLVYINPAFETVWGRSKSHILSNPRNFLTYVFADDKPLVIAEYRNYLAGEKYDLEVSHSASKWPTYLG
jgi:PAS domain-containing protein